jgi:adenylate cyclase
MRLHESVAAALEAAYGERAPEIAAQLAWHYDQAGLADKAVNYLLLAGQQAMRLAAYREAIRHFERGLALLPGLPPSLERNGRELDLRLPLSSALIVTRGWAAPERFAALPESITASEQIKNSGQAVRVLILRASVLQAQGQLAQSLAVSEEALAIAQRLNDRQGRLLAYGGLGITYYLGGSWRAAHAHLKNALALYSPTEDRPLLAAIGADPQSFLQALLATNLWVLGLSDQARASAARSVELAEALGQPLNHATIIGHLLVLRARAGFEGDFEGDVEYLLRVGREQDWPEIRNIGEVMRGWWLAGAGATEAETGLEQMKAAFATWPPVGKVGLLPVATSLYAGRCLQNGRMAEGLAAVDEMLALCRKGIGRLVEPEFHRLRGGFLSVESPDEAEACYQRSLEVAREQGAASLELRAAVSLARHWQQRGRAAEARELVAAVYGGFTEGFDTPDLREAAALLAAA